MNWINWIIQLNKKLITIQMADEEVLYGVGTLTEIKKKIMGKTLAKHHDLNAEMQT